jgi:hypothetical protein
LEPAAASKQLNEQDRESVIADYDLTGMITNCYNTLTTGDSSEDELTFASMLH